jgi:hypothetical protein
MAANIIFQKVIALLWLSRFVASDYIHLAGEKRVVYGDDNRKDAYQIPPSSREFFSIDSSVSLISKSSLTLSGGSYSFNSHSRFQDAYGLCDDQRYLDQNTKAFCSGMCTQFQYFR